METTQPLPLTYNPKVHPVGYSLLKIITESPKLFLEIMNRRLNKDETEEDYFDLGKAVHCLALRPQDFDKEFLVHDTSIPEGKYATAIQILARTEKEFSPDTESRKRWYANAVAGAELKMKYDTVYLKLTTDPELLAYYDFLKASEGRITISKPQYQIAQDCVEVMRNHKLIRVWLNSPANAISVETEILWSHPKFPDIPLSSTPDLVLSCPGITIILDIKTISKSVYTKFPAQAEYFGYHRQLAVYRQAVRKGSDEETHCFLVAVQTKGLPEVVAYHVPEELLTLGEREFEAQLETLNWHIKTDQWEYPRSYYEGSGEVVLNYGKNWSEKSGETESDR